VRLLVVFCRVFENGRNDEFGEAQRKKNLNSLGSDRFGSPTMGIDRGVTIYSSFTIESIMSGNRISTYFINNMRSQQDGELKGRGQRWGGKKKGKWTG